MSYTSSAASSRRQSMMLPPAIPIGGSIGGALGSPGFAPASYGSDIGPGPQRHPKPLTAADLHLQLEREQEAVVNRLTRELAALRAQQSPNALEEPPTPTTNSPILHHNYSSPHLPRHHRTGSNTSISATGGGVGPNTLSRQNSTRSVRSVNTGGRSSPAIGDLLPLPPHTSLAPTTGGGLGTYPYAGYYGYQYQGGLGIATPSANGSMVDLSGSNTENSLAETIKWRNELENAKRENEALRKRIKELEKILKEAAGVEPEGWSGGSVSGMSGMAHPSRDRRSRSSSISLKERGRREKRPGDERGGPRKEEGEKSCDMETKKQVDDAPTVAASAEPPVSPEKTEL